MKILLTGASGQLGYHIQREFAEHELFLGDSANFDITNHDLVLRKIEDFKPEVVIHTAAYTNVGGAEVEREKARLINMKGTRNVAQAAKAVGATLVAISTDYVFAGDKNLPYTETDPVGPKSYYGQTKAEGEQIIKELLTNYYLCRTSWLYGGIKPSPKTDLNKIPYKNFVNTMLRVGKDRTTVEVVDDQIGAPTYAADLAKIIKQLLPTKKYGLYHVSNSGVTNWADFASYIFNKARYSTVVTHIKTADWVKTHPQSAPRPAYSVLDHQALKEAGFAEPRSWQAAIDDFLANY